MKLAAYLKANGLTARSFAARVELSEPTISRLIHGVHKPDWSTVSRIFDATDGAVTANDWMTDDKAKAAPVENADGSNAPSATEAA